MRTAGYIQPQPCPGALIAVVDLRPRRVALGPTRQAAKSSEIGGRIVLDNFQMREKRPRIGQRQPGDNAARFRDHVSGKHEPAVAERGRDGERFSPEPGLEPAKAIRRESRQPE
jgi:hypothetical protein